MKKGLILLILGFFYVFGCWEYGLFVVNDLFEIYWFVGMGMQFGVNVFEYCIVFFVYLGDCVEFWVQVVFLGDLCGIVGEVEGGIVWQFEGVVEWFVVDFVVYVEVYIGVGFGVLLYFVVDMDIDVLLVEVGQVDQMEVVWFEYDEFFGGNWNQFSQG